MQRNRQLGQVVERSLQPWVVSIYRFRHLRGLVRRYCDAQPGGLMLSATWRAILKRYHGVSVGAYSYGSLMRPGVLPTGTIVGRYVSCGSALIVRRRDHPTDRPIMHPYFYNAALGVVAEDTIAAVSMNPLTIGHDVWIGDRVTILSGCRRIGNGAVLAAGAVVTKDVADYAIVGGVPAKQLRLRFSATEIADLEASRWWDKDIKALVENPPKGAFGPDFAAVSAGTPNMPVTVETRRRESTNDRRSQTPSHPTWPPVVPTIRDR